VTAPFISGMRGIFHRKERSDRSLRARGRAQPAGASARAPPRCSLNSHQASNAREGKNDKTETSYPGLRLPHPFIVGSSPFGYSLDSVRRLEDAGAAAVVLHSPFEEQITTMVEGRIAGMNWDDPAFSRVFAGFPSDGRITRSPPTSTPSM
jgi:hypothetical protein